MRGIEANLWYIADYFSFGKNVDSPARGFKMDNRQHVIR